MTMTSPLPHDADPLEEIMRAALAAGGRELPAAAPVAAPVDPRVDSRFNQSPQDPLAAAFDRPASPGDYAIQIPRGLARDAAFEERARRWFHEAGLPQNVVNGIVQEYCRCLVDAPGASPDEHQVMAELAREWGPECAGKIDLARAVIARCGNAEEVAEALAASGLGNNPWLIRSLAALSALPPPHPREGVMS